MIPKELKLKDLIKATEKEILRWKNALDGKPIVTDSSPICGLANKTADELKENDYCRFCPFVFIDTEFGFGCEAIGFYMWKQYSAYESHQSRKIRDCGNKNYHKWSRCAAKRMLGACEKILEELKNEENKS